MRVHRRAAVLGMAACAAAVSLIAAPAASAAPSFATGELCAAVVDTPFYFNNGTASPWTYVYTVPAGGGIRLDDNYYYVRPGSASYYAYGHGNGHSAAYFPVDNTTC